MRVTNRQMSNIVKQSLGNNAKILLKAQEKVATRKSVNRPSDDPAAMGRILDYRTTLSSIEQYSRNIALAKNSIEFSEMQLEEVCDQLQKTKNIIIGASDAEESDRRKTADDIQDIYDGILDIANTKLGDDYIFAGHRNGPEPVDCAEVTCKPASELSSGDYYTIDTIDSIDDDYYVWYNIGGVGDKPDPDPDGRTPIEVPIATDDSASDVATATITAISNAVGSGLTASSIVGNPSRIEILDNGNPPEIADNDTGFTLRTMKYQDTEPFTACAEVTCTSALELSSGDYYTIGDDYYVWYNDGDDADPAPDGRTPIEVPIATGDSASDVATATVIAISAVGGGLTAASIVGNPSRIEIFDNGNPPEIAEINTGFTLHTAKYNGDDGDLNFMVSKTLKIKGNATGSDVFTGESLTDGVNVLDTLKALKDAFLAPTYDSDRVSELKDELIKGFEQVEKAAVDLSVSHTRLESTENYWGRFKLSIEDMLSNTEEADLAEAIVELQTQQTAYEAALAASASLFDKSLMDFLR